MATTQGKPMRADARRNYERLLIEARVAFLERGTDASLEDIARSAGVGIGTLYRHFPDRFALMEAVFQGEVDTLEAEAAALAGAERGPFDALLAWVRAYVTWVGTFRGVATALLHEGRMANCHTQLTSTAEKLVVRAQEAGELHPDATTRDVLRLANAISYAAEKAAQKTPDDVDVADRLLKLAVEGLRR
ncbi:TetR/AcrR family transcriptional regulator [Streptomyces sp. A7024]|uniref:TetR/AcrR family transcriptional regulator n=1 Tax=Streptomyces coryli TaxID=1128680 RepID=A0A6G4UBK4_9ACTN|nr:TetR/AcrR family transcriptional regulator [Streptomyces coryli]NGN68707.1 TetR/AcrR family transcriptional regulator [Streptomyces coryli]